MDTLYTVEDLEQLDGDFELDEGVLVPMNPPKPLHASLVIRIGARLLAHAEAGDLGTVLGGDAGFALRCNPDTLRGIDVAFVRAERARNLFDDVYPQGAPDLAVEVLPPGDRPGQVLRKVSQVLEAGCSLLWVVDPRRRRVTVYQGDEVRVLSEGETLEGGDILPGFSWPLVSLFGQPAP